MTQIEPEHQQHEGQDQDSSAQVPPEPEVEVTFLDRALAFIALIYPFSLLIDKMQEILTGRFGSSLNNIMVLVGIVAFLLVVNMIAKRIYAYRKKKKLFV